MACIHEDREIELILFGNRRGIYKEIADSLWLYALSLHPINAVCRVLQFSARMVYGLWHDLIYF